MWYDVFSLFYDRALEGLYKPFRQAAVEALHLQSGNAVLDVPCGTGQGFDALTTNVGQDGLIVGVDRSTGMLRKAKRRIRENEWDNVVLVQSPVGSLDKDLLEREVGVTQFDGVICSLGLTAFPAWEDSFRTLFDSVRPGGRMVIFDVYASKPSRESKAVEIVARADLSNRVWELLESEATEFERVILDADVKKFGGELFIASGSKRAV